MTSYLLEFFSHSRGSTFKEGTLPFLYKLSWALEVLTFRADHMHFLWPRFLKIDAHVIQTHMNTNTLCETQTNKPPPEYGLHCRLAGHSALLDLDLSLFCGVLLPQGFGNKIMNWRICIIIILWINISIIPSKLRCSHMLSDPAWRVYELLCTCSEHGTKLKSKKQNVDALEIEFSRYPTLSTFSSVAGPKDSITSTLVSYLAFGASTSFLAPQVL